MEQSTVPGELLADITTDNGEVRGTSKSVPSCGRITSIAVINNTVS